MLLYWESSETHKTVCCQNTELLNAKLGGRPNNHCDLKTTDIGWTEDRTNLNIEYELYFMINRVLTL